MASKEAKVKELEAIMESQDFWNDNDKAQRIIAECNKLRAWTVPYNSLKSAFNDVKELLPEAYDTQDQALDFRPPARTYLRG